MKAKIIILSFKFNIELIMLKEFNVFILVLVFQLDNTRIDQFVGVKPAVEPGSEIVIVLPYF